MKWFGSGNGFVIRGGPGYKLLVGLIIFVIIKEKFISII
jgi:hypothetical protein